LERAAAHAKRQMERYTQDPELAKKKLRDHAKARHTRDRKAAIQAYGGKCVCCGETRYEFLTLQHPNKDGHLHRKEVLGKQYRNGASKFLRKIRKAGFPQKFKIEIACWNCHMSHDMHGKCPHKNE
jgi:hypothetical protein